LYGLARKTERLDGREANGKPRVETGIDSNGLIDVAKGRFHAAFRR
jgi:hypothetical protein